MTQLYIAPTRSTPEVRLDPSSHVHLLRGESYPENSSKFYEPILGWLRDYLPASNGASIVFDFEIVYFNSSTSKIFMDLFDLLDAHAKRGKSITINWRHDPENEIARECGEEFMDEVNELRFNLVRV